MLHGLKPRRMYLHLLVLKADRYFGERQHVSVQTTERYLGCTQRFRNAVNDQIGLENRFYFMKKNHKEGEVLDHQRRADRVREIKVELERLMTRKIA